MSKPAACVEIQGQSVRGRKKKACQRCRSRKQRCDAGEPACQNCFSAGVGAYPDSQSDSSLTLHGECLPVPQEAHVQYPVRYVQSLEQHAAELERKLNERLPGSAADHMPVATDLTPQGECPRRSADRESHILFQEPGDLSNTRNPSYARTLRDQWHAPDILPDATQRTHSDNHDIVTFAEYHRSSVSSASPPQDFNVPSATEDITISTAASFFRTYFAYIHPQYPFLSIEDCNEWYLQWRAAPKHLPIRGWPAFFVKMVCLALLVSEVMLNVLDLCHRLVNTVPR